MFLMLVRRLTAAALAASFLAFLVPAAAAEDPYKIDAILSLTGQSTFVGQTQLIALKAAEAYVNRTGGIRGRPISFVVTDDQSNTQNTVQLLQTLLPEHPPFIFGPSSAAACSAVTPLVVSAGPVVYCLANAGHPTPGGYVFETLPSTDAMLSVVLRYFRERGWDRVAYIVSTDAGGQDAERALLLAASAPENKSVEIVAREHFAPADISVAAQIARIKASNANALVAWSTGTGAGTIFHDMHDAGLDVVTSTSPGNLNAAFFKQYGSILPQTLLFAGVPFYAGNALGDPATKAAIATLSAALAPYNATPDQIEISTWDPALLLVDALRKLGTDTSPARLRAYLLDVRGWVGANGPYDFRAIPQRGIGENNLTMVRWDAQRNAGYAVSAFGGTPLHGE